ncbi:MAG: sigma-70 family RNA polymerase sigma factor [Labilithrix sp.]
MATGKTVSVDWERLVAQHQRAVLLTLLSRGVRLDRARDIVQETWARLIAHERTGRLTRLEMPGLAIRQALFLAADDARRRRHDTVADDAEIAAVIDPAPNAEQRLVTRAQLELASAELDRCAPKARAVFDLVYDDAALPHAEAAKRVGLSVQRVRQTLCEVRAKLRAALSDDIDHERAIAVEASHD